MNCCNGPDAIRGCPAAVVAVTCICDVGIGAAQIQKHNMNTIAGTSYRISLLTIVAATHALRLAGLMCGWLECMRRHHIDLLIGRRHMGACGCENGRHRNRRLWCVWSRWIWCAGTARCERLSRRVQHMLLDHWRAAGGAAGTSGAAIACCRATARGWC